MEGKEGVGIVKSFVKSGVGIVKSHMRDGEGILRSYVRSGVGPHWLLLSEQSCQASLQKI